MKPPFFIQLFVAVFKPTFIPTFKPTSPHKDVHNSYCSRFYNKTEKAYNKTEQVYSKTEGLYNKTFAVMSVRLPFSYRGHLSHITARCLKGSFAVF